MIRHMENFRGTSVQERKGHRSRRPDRPGPAAGLAPSCPVSAMAKSPISLLAMGKALEMAIAKLCAQNGARAFAAPL